MVMLVAHRGTW